MAKKKRAAEVKRGTLLFLNVKLLPNNGYQDYIVFFQQLQKMDYAVNVRADRYIALFDLESLFDGRVWRGRLVEYTSLDPNGFIDLETKESINKPYEDENIGANQKKGYFYFIPEAHRLAILKNSEININTVKKYIDEAGSRLFLEQQVYSIQVYTYIEKTKDILEVLRSAYSVTYLKAKLTYTNKDHTSGFEKLFDEKLRESGATEVEMELKTEKKESLSFTDESLATSIVEISQSNGEIEARVIEEEGDKVKRFNTEEYPREKSIKYTLETLSSVIYNEIMSIFRNSDNE